MRPDPYKLARSRQYKAKHGLTEKNSYQKNTDNLPSNISDEIYLPSSEENDTEDNNYDQNLNISEALSSFQSVIEDNSKVSKYPKDVFDKIFPSTEPLKFSISYSHEAEVAKLLDLPVEYLTDSNSILRLNNNSSPISSNLSNNSQLKLHTNLEMVVSKVMAPNSVNKFEAVDLEEWLNDVL